MSYTSSLDFFSFHSFDYGIWSRILITTNCLTQLVISILNILENLYSNLPRSISFTAKKMDLFSHFLAFPLLYKRVKEWTSLLKYSEFIWEIQSLQATIGLISSTILDVFRVVRAVKTLLGIRLERASSFVKGIMVCEIVMSLWDNKQKLIIIEKKSKIQSKKLEKRRIQISFLRDVIDLLALFILFSLPKQTSRYLQIIPLVMQSVAFSLGFILSLS